MKKIAILTLLLTSKAFAHEAIPETKFFQDEVKKNPMIQNILTWCSLVGIDSEEACKNEMYGEGRILDPIRLDAATKCVEKSGLKYRVALDNFFKASTKDASLVSHADKLGERHLYPAKGPKGTEWQKEHYYYYTAVDREESSRQMGNDFVNTVKNKTAEIISTLKLGGEWTVGAKVAPEVLTAKLGEVSSELKGIIEKAVTQGTVTQDLLNEASNRGIAYGRSHPESAGRKPSGTCDVGGYCIQIDKRFPESQLQAEVNKDVVPKLGSPVAAEPSAPATSGPTPQDPFAPFTSGTATGGMSTAPKTPEKPKDPKNPDSTTVSPEVFTANLNDCMTREIAKIHKDLGSKSVDPETETNERKKAQADRKLLDGNCDEAFFGVNFCADWRQERARSKAENAEADKQAAYEDAFKNWQANGVCDSMVLGFAFCQNAHSQLVTMPTDSESPDTGTIADGVTQPDSAVPVDGDHISIDPNAWHPPETSPND